MSLIARLRKGRQKRSQFVESHLVKGIAYQLRATRDERGWSQERLAEEVGMPQNAISRLESPDYGRYTLTTLRRLAAALDVALIVRLVPFSQLVDWVSGTPRIEGGLSSSALGVPDFEKEETLGVFADRPDGPTPSLQQGLTGRSFSVLNGTATGMAYRGQTQHGTAFQVGYALNETPSRKTVQSATYAYAKTGERKHG